MAKKKDKAPEFRLKIRTYQQSNWCDVWIVGSRGGVHTCDLHGTWTADVAEGLAAVIGIPVEREASPFAIDGKDDLAVRRPRGEQRALAMEAG